MYYIESQQEFYDRFWTRSQVLKRIFYFVANSDVRARYRAVLRMIRASMNPSRPKAGLQILDLGCGTGTLSTKLTRFGEVTGIELSPKAIEVAQRRYPTIKFIAGDFLHERLGRSEYDLVVSSEVIEHLPIQNRPQYVDVIHDALRPGGVLVLTTPNGPVQRRLGVRGEQLIENWLSPRELRDLIEKRFEIHRFTSFCFAIRPLTVDLLWRLMWPIVLPIEYLLLSRDIPEKGKYLVLVARKRQ